MAKRCPNCSYINQENDKFCRNCGGTFFDFKSKRKLNYKLLIVLTTLLIAVLLLCVLIFSNVSTCEKPQETDLYTAEYYGVENEKDSLKIVKFGDVYSVQMDLEEGYTLNTAGIFKNETIYLVGSYIDGDILYGEIEEYGSDEPLEVELYSYENYWDYATEEYEAEYKFLDEFEFEKKE